MTCLTGQIPVGNTLTVTIALHEQNPCPRRVSTVPGWCKSPDTARSDWKTGNSEGRWRFLRYHTVKTSLTFSTETCLIPWSSRPRSRSKNTVCRDINENTFMQTVTCDTQCKNSRVMLSQFVRQTEFHSWTVNPLCNWKMPIELSLIHVNIFLSSMSLLKKKLEIDSFWFVLMGFDGFCSNQNFKNMHFG